MKREEMKLRIKRLENQLSSQSWKTLSDNTVFAVIHSAITTTIKNAQHVLQALGRLLLPCRRLNSLSNMNAVNILTIVLTILFAIPSCSIIDDIIPGIKSTKRINKIIRYYKKNSKYSVIEEDSTIVNLSYIDNRLSQIHTVDYSPSDINGVTEYKPKISFSNFDYKEDSVIITTTDEWGKSSVRCLLNENNYISSVIYNNDNNFFANIYCNYSSNGYLQSITYNSGMQLHYGYDENWNLMEAEIYFSSYTDIPNISEIYVFDSSLSRGRNLDFGLWGKASAYLPKEAEDKAFRGHFFLFDYELDKEGYVKIITIERRTASGTSYTFYEYFYE
jgi:hypothetical protein